MLCKAYKYGWSFSRAWHVASPTAARQTPEAIFVATGCDCSAAMYRFSNDVSILSGSSLGASCQEEWGAERARKQLPRKSCLYRQPVGLHTLLSLAWRRAGDPS